MPHDVIAFTACAGIMVGLLLSRALISISIIMLIANALLNIHLQAHIKSFLTKPHLLLLTGYFVLMGISGCWSSNTAYFAERMQIMLPFLVLPFAFHSMQHFEDKWIDRLLMIFISITFVAICWSLFHYFSDKANFDKGYGYSHVIPTPNNDHIRFSIMVVFSICFAADLCLRYAQKWQAWLYGLFLIFAVYYLHVLSVKTGIVVFYLTAVLFFIRLVIQKKYRRIALLIVVAIALLPVLMYNLSASFRNKIGYVRYSITEMGNQQKQANISDEGRLISYTYALDAIRNHPIIGVGIGDVADKMQDYYIKDKHQRSVQWLLPHNQLLMAGMAIGIPGILYLLLLFFVLGQRCFRHSFLASAAWVILCFTSMIEPLFETQYGSCMFLFFLLLLLQRRSKSEI
jgi:O-antigen ligase